MMHFLTSALRAVSIAAGIVGLSGIVAIGWAWGSKIARGWFGPPVVAIQLVCHHVGDDDEGDEEEAETAAPVVPKVEDRAVLS